MKEYRVAERVLVVAGHPEGLVRRLLFAAGFDMRRGYTESREWGELGLELVFRQEDEPNVEYKVVWRYGYGDWEERKLEDEVEYWFWKLKTPEPKWDNSVSPARLEYPLGWGEKAREVNRGVLREILRSRG